MGEQTSEAALGDGDVTRADGALLQRWAFGRAETAAERERAAAALAELERRAALERAAMAPSNVGTSAAGDSQPAPGDGADGAAESEHPGAVDDSARRRRMLRTGLAGVLAAALAVPIVATQLALPDPDPLAIFERPSTADDLAMVETLELLTNGSATTEPRVVYSTDRGAAVAFRSSTVPGGESTAWDIMCLSWITGSLESGNWGAAIDCASPRQFAADGVAVDIGVTTAGESARRMVWGPSGPPQLAPLGAPARVATSSPLELLAHPGGGPDASLEGIGDSSRLLMGPATVLNAGQGRTDEELDVALFLQSSRAPEEGEPLLCVRGFVTYAPAAIGCRPLDAALREGLTLYVPSRAGGWFVAVRPDGMIHTEPVSDDSSFAATTVPGG